ncbi:hypothetical protein ONZ45_g15398 [Pleurotus djamor]|nr:hypothetical protein ONZ45_g15398 [Pleurotus djamor]
MHMRVSSTVPQSIKPTTKPKLKLANSLLERRQASSIWVSFPPLSPVRPQQQKQSLNEATTTAKTHTFQPNVNMLAADGPAVVVVTNSDLAAGLDTTTSASASGAAAPTAAPTTSSRPEPDLEYYDPPTDVIQQPASPVLASSTSNTKPTKRSAQAKPFLRSTLSRVEFDAFFAALSVTERDYVLSRTPGKDPKKTGSLSQQGKHQTCRSQVTEGVP